MSITETAAYAALVISAVNLTILIVRVGHDIKLRQIEIAFKLVDAEYRRLEIALRAKGLETPIKTYPPPFLLDLYLGILKRIYKTGKYDFEVELKKSMEILLKFHEADKKARGTEEYKKMKNL